MFGDIERKRLRKVYSKKKGIASAQFLFGTADEFVKWWEQQIDEQDGRCAYCHTPINLIRSLIAANLLGTRRTRGNGKRGLFLELERKDPRGNYEPDNCVLVCMPCNNDKSNTYSHEDYKRFFGSNRKAHYEWLATQLSPGMALTEDPQG